MPQLSNRSQLAPRMMGREVKCPECDARSRFLRKKRSTQPSKSARPRSVSYGCGKADRRHGSLQSPAATQFQSPTARPTKPVPKPKVEEEEDEEPLIERRALRNDHIDMTPMVDITFLLLIFFMSTANFTLQKSLEVPVQKQQKASTRAVQVANDETHDSVTVQIDEFNAYLVFCRTVRIAKPRASLI